MTAPREIADRREAYEDDADNVRAGRYDAAIGSLVDMAKAQAKGDRELAQLRATVKRVEALCDAEDARVAEANARYAERGLIDAKSGKGIHVVPILKARDVRAALEGDQ